MAQTNKYGIPALTYSNFAVWRPRVLGLLESKGMQDALTDDGHADSSKALGLLKLLMDDSILSMMDGIDNCSDAWDALQDLFASTTAANIMQLKKQFNSFSMKGKESIAAYMQRARKLQFEMSAAEVQVTDADLMMTILQGLPTEYGMIKTIIVNTEPLPTYNTVLGRLLRVEADHKAAETSSAFMAGPAGRQQGGYRNRGGYGAAGHSANNPYNSSSGGYDSDNDDSNSSMGEVKNKQGIRCHYCHKRGHLKKECYKLQNDRAARSRGNGNGGGGYRGGGTGEARQPRSMAFMVGAGSTESTDWFLDSAASKHLTTDMSVLSKIYTLSTPVEVKFANGHTGQATLAGDVTLQHNYTGETMTLKEVLYAPCVYGTVNLISVGRVVCSQPEATHVTFAKGFGIITGDDGFIAYAPYTSEGLYALKDWYPVRPNDDGSSSSGINIGSS